MWLIIPILVCLLILTLKARVRRITIFEVESNSEWKESSDFSGVAEVFLWYDTFETKTVLKFPLCVRFEHQQWKPASFIYTKMFTGLVTLP